MGMCMGPDGLPKLVWRLLRHKVKHLHADTPDVACRSLILRY